MWHEARKQERKIRGMLVDYRKRAERRRDFYEKIKADPTQFLQVHGRQYKIHLDPAVAAAAEGPATMMPWQGNNDNLIDRFDVRAHLDFIPHVKSDEEEIKSYEERQINYERYRIIAQNSFLTITEEKFLKQLHLEEQFGYTENEPKKKKVGGAAIGFNYEDGTGTSQYVPPEEENSDENSDSDLDVDLSINVSKLDQSQAHEMNRHGRNFGMSSNDFYSFLTHDLEEAENFRLAKEEEHEKALFSGRKSRRERRAHREKRLANRKISPPSYAARESPTVKLDLHEKSESRSPSPENTGKITFITSFGGEEEPQMPAKPTYADKVKYGKKLKKLREASEEKVLYLDRNIFKRSSSRGRAIFNKRHRNSNDRSRRSRSRSKRRRSSSSSSSNRSRRYISRSNSRSRKRLRERSRSRSNAGSKRSKSRERIRPKRSASPKRGRSLSRERNSKRSKSSSSRSSTSASPPRNTRNEPRTIRRSRTTSPMSKSKSISKSRSTSRSASPSKSKSKSPFKESPPKAIPRYYGRKRSDQSSSEISEDDEDENAANPTNNLVIQNTNLKIGNSGTSTKPAPATNLNLQERLKRKRQALLNKQFKADKIAEQMKTDREKQEQQTREEELREMALKLRKKQRERRHAYDSDSDASSNSDTKTTSNGNKRSSTPSPKRTSREREYRSRERESKYKPEKETDYKKREHRDDKNQRNERYYRRSPKPRDERRDERERHHERESNSRDDRRRPVGRDIRDRRDRGDGKSLVDY